MDDALMHRKTLSTLPRWGNHFTRTFCCSGSRRTVTAFCSTAAMRRLASTFLLRARPWGPVSDIGSWRSTQTQFRVWRSVDSSAASCSSTMGGLDTKITMAKALPGSAPALARGPEHVPFGHHRGCWQIWGEGGLLPLGQAFPMLYGLRACGVIQPAAGWKRWSPARDACAGAAFKTHGDIGNCAY